jgi:hypothetical protein
VVLNTTGLVDKPTDVYLTRDSDLTAGAVQITYLSSSLMLSCINHVIVYWLHSSYRMASRLFIELVIDFMFKCCWLSVSSVVFYQAVIDLIHW